jgi:hypothetical protein
MLQTILRVIAWSALVCIAIATLSAIGLRPVVTANPLYERFAAFAILAALFGLAYPGRTIFFDPGTVIAQARNGFVASARRIVGAVLSLT